MGRNTKAGGIAGPAAWLATVAIGTGWQLATRHGVTSTLGPLDLALLRYGVPALLLLPVLWRHGFLPHTAPRALLALIVIGGGLPFGLLGMAGALFAPAAHMGALLPGAMPLFVAGLGALFLGERLNGGRRWGLGLIALGAFCVTASAFTPFGLGFDRTVLLGDGLFLAAGLVWAVYTVAFRRSGLAVWHAAALICFWSFVLLIPLWLLGPQSRLLTVPAGELGLQIFAQGVAAGLLGLWAYGLAIERLGAGAAATSGALVPVGTALGGWLLLDEPVGMLVGLGVVLVASGLLLFSGVRRARQEAAGTAPCD